VFGAVKQAALGQASLEAFFDSEMLRPAQHSEYRQFLEQLRSDPEPLRRGQVLSGDWISPSAASSELLGSDTVAAWQANPSAASMIMAIVVEINSLMVDSPDRQTAIDLSKERNCSLHLFIDNC